MNLSINQFKLNFCGSRFILGYWSFIDSRVLNKIFEIAQLRKYFMFAGMINQGAYLTFVSLKIFT
ncbi:protein of unknown function [Candidatus Nitrosocosmicus franklandus]|uniref:Uncharacterized protein n=1 Tax=Candidatus Nitrosocosmicus franklandianus TaxID=1798806 RepID=A0A484IE17_9ARCH|nr:protein of unknown function [Candidatus Nitrosocosmicus franklandus]